MPEGLFAGRVHLDDLVAKMRISHGELALLKVEAMIELMDKTETFETMSKRGYLVTNNTEFVNAYVHYRIKKSFSVTQEELDGFVEL